MGDSVNTKTDSSEKENTTENNIKTDQEKPDTVLTEKNKPKPEKNDEGGEKKASKGDTEGEKVSMEVDKEKPKAGTENSTGKTNEVVTKKEDMEENTTETILSSQSLKSSDPSISMTNDSPATPTVDPSTLKPIKHVDRNQSDILPSLREVPRDEDPSLMIFSSKGLPTKKFFKRREVNSTILPFGFNEKEGQETAPTTPRVRAEAELTPKINQTVPKKAVEDAAASKKTPFGDKNPSVTRNVLTGLGLSSNDEFRGKSARRKDGNPVLGVGYEEPVVANNTGRVPPGGFSSGLW